MQALASMLSANQPQTHALMRADVVDHVQRLLNSRAGQSASAPFYGLASSVDCLRVWMAQLPQSQDTIQHMIVQTIGAHEQRLCEWRAHGAPQLGHHALVVTLRGRWRLSPQWPDLVLDVYVSPLARMTVRA